MGGGDSRRHHRRFPRNSRSRFPKPILPGKMQRKIILSSQPLRLPDPDTPATQPGAYLAQALDQFTMTLKSVLPRFSLTKMNSVGFGCWAGKSVILAHASNLDGSSRFSWTAALRIHVWVWNRLFEVVIASWQDRPTRVTAPTPSRPISSE